jgi:hypothetical protein
MTRASDTPFRVGWAEIDITPEQPVMMAGQFHIRIAEGVADRLTATVMAIESAPPGTTTTQAILVSCDLIAITDGLRDQAFRNSTRRAWC